MQKIDLTVVLPAYNEEENIEKSVRDALAVLQRLCNRYEVIVVNDGSRDRTGEIADRLAAEIPEVRAIHHNPNQGYAAALRNGFLATETEYTFYTDSDNQFDYSDLERLIPLAPGNDLVVGYRQDRQDAWIRIFVSRCYNKLVSTIFRLGVRDIDCAFKLFRRDVFDKIDIRSQGFLVDTEILVKSRLAGLRLAEVGVRHLPREAGESTVTPWDVFRTLRGIWWLWWTLFSINWLKLLTALGISAAFIGMLVYSITDFEWSDVPDTFAAMGKWHLVGALAMYAVSFWLRSWRWQGILSPFHSIRMAALFPSIAVGWAGNNLFPFRLGELLRAYDLGNNRRFSRGLAFGTIVAERVMDAFTLVLLLGLTVFLLPGFRGHPDVAWIFTGGALVFIVLFATCLYLAAGSVGGRSIVYAVFNWIFRSLFRTFNFTAEQFLEGLRVLLNERIMLRALGISILVWFAEGAMFLFFFTGLAQEFPAFSDFSLFHAVAMTCLLNMGLAIPSASAYLGTYEAFCVIALAILFPNLPSETALSYAILLHLTQFIPITLIGIVFFQRNSLRVVDTRSLGEVVA